MVNLYRFIECKSYNWVAYEILRDKYHVDSIIPIDLLVFIENCTDLETFKRVYKKLENVIKRESSTFSYLCNNTNSEVIRYFLDQVEWQVTERYDLLKSVTDLTDYQKPPSLDVIKFFCQPCFDDRREITYAAMDNAAKNGSLEIVKYLHDNRSEGCTVNAIDGAAKMGHLDVVIYLSENRTEGCTTRAIDKAASRGHLDVVKYLSEHRTEGCTENAMDKAAKHNHLNIVEYLHSHRTEGASENAMDYASMNGHLSIVQFLHRSRSEGCTEAAMDLAAANGHMSVVQFLHQSRSEGCTTAAMDDAAMCGDIDMMSWLHTNRSEGCSKMACDYASYCGSLYNDRDINETLKRSHLDGNRQKYHECLEFLHCNRTEGHTLDFVSFIARSNNIAAIPMLRPDLLTKYRWHNSLIQAASYGCVEMMQFFLGYDSIVKLISAAEWDEVLGCACSFGYLSILKLLYPIRLALQPDDMQDACVGYLLAAVCSSHLEILEYITQTNGKPVLEDQHKVIEEALQHGQISATKYLHQVLGYALPEDIPAMTVCDLSVINYLIENGCRFNYPFLKEVVGYGALPILKLAYDRDTPDIDTLLLLRTAAKFAHLHIIEYLCQHPVAIGLMNDQDFSQLMRVCMDHTQSVACLRYILANYHYTVKPLISISDRSSILLLQILQANGFTEDNFKHLGPNEFDEDEDYDDESLPVSEGPYRTLLLEQRPYLANGQPHPFQQYVKRVIENSPDGKINMDELPADKPLVSIIPFLSPIGTCTTQSMDDAAAYGDLSLLQYLHYHRTEGCTSGAMDEAASNGYLSVVQFLHFNRTEGCTVRAMDEASANGYLSVVQFLHSHRTEGCTTKAMNGAIKNQLLTIVQFLHTKRTEGCTFNTIKNALEKGEVTTVLQYIISKQYPHDPKINELLSVARKSMK
eukprot:gene17751-21171_t